MPRLNFTPEEAGALREATESLIREGLRIPGASTVRPEAALAEGPDEGAEAPGGVFPVRGRNMEDSDTPQNHP